MRRLYSAGVVAVALVFTGAGTSYAGAGGLPTREHAAPAVGNRLPTREEIAALFVRWNNALATRDARRVADLYAPDAVLLPTRSARIRTNRAQIVDYFEHFLRSSPVGRIQERFIFVLSPTAAVDTGRYQFTLTGKNGRKSTVDARYTFVYELRGGQWLIINHHSSEVPAED